MDREDQSSSDDETEDGDQEEMTTMFSAVYVKMEVMEEEDMVEEPESEDILEPTLTRTRSKNRKTLKCDLCDYTTVYKNCFQLHERSHSLTKPFSCKQCDYATKHPLSLERHMYTMHETKEPDGKNLPDFNCEKCEYTTKIKWNLYSHRRKHKTVKNYKCSKCLYASAYRQDYVKHVKCHDRKPNQVYQCDKCSFFTKFQGHIVRHLSQIHNETTDKAFSCQYCGLTTLVKWRLNKHLIKSKVTVPVKCMICQFETFYKCESRKHKISHCTKDALLNYATKNVSGNINHENEVSGLESGVGSTNESELINNVETQKLFNQSFNESMTQYVNTQQFDEDYADDNLKTIEWNNIPVKETNCTKRFQCDMCDYKSKFKAAVQRHYQRRHTKASARPYKCTICGFSTKTKDQISLHAKRSKLDSPIMCRDCEFTALFKCEMAVHQKTHYSYKCDSCNAAYKQIYELKRHYASMHLGEGMNCQFCDYKTMRKECLVSHMTTHTGVKPFKCQYCPYGTMRRHTLDYHIRKNHSEMIPMVVPNPGGISTLDKLLTENISV